MSLTLVISALESGTSPSGWGARNTSGGVGLAVAAAWSYAFVVLSWWGHGGGYLHGTAGPSYHVKDIKENMTSAPFWQGFS